MDVYVGNQRVKLDPKSQIGSGGEGVVFRTKLNSADTAVKIYHQYDSLRERKLRAFLKKSWQLPLDRVALPLDEVRDNNGRTIGLTMPFFAGYQDVAELSSKKFRAANNVNTLQIARLFLDGGRTLRKIHSGGLVIGDFNDFNTLFDNPTMAFIDVDAWQFDSFPCMVATEQFLVPELYNIDLSQRAVFRKEYDWYSFAVMLFKSILCVHPFGGAHKSMKRMTTRAMKKITVFDPKVIYPKIAFPPDLLDDKMMGAFEDIFAKGLRAEFPLDILEEYTDSLVQCSKCGTYYPGTQGQCPVCNERTLMVITKPVSVTDQASVVELIRTNGPIVFHNVVNDRITVIAYESGKAVLYRKIGNGAVKRQELFDQIKGAKFELTGDILVVNRPSDTKLLLLDISGPSISKVATTVTNMFASSKRAMFRGSPKYLFHFVADSLLVGEIRNGQLAESLLRMVMPDQTWFVVKQDFDRPTACGFFKIMSAVKFWLVWEGEIFDDLPVRPMNEGEILVDLSVRFSGQSVLIRRLTQDQGVDYIYTDIVDRNAKSLYSSPRIKLEDHSFPNIHGLAFANGKLIHSTDNGLAQEDVTGNKIVTFDSTANAVSEGDSLYLYNGGMLAVRDESVVHIRI